MHAPRVSVLLPARNGIRTLDAAIRSILAQTLEALELIVVDDGSTDGSDVLLAALAREDARVRVITTRGEGLVTALARGWAECRAAFVARMDADDLSHPERLAHSVAALEREPALAAVGTGVEIFRDDRPPSPGLVSYAAWISSLTSPERLAQERFIESPLCHPAVTLRKSAVDEVGLWREGDFPEDYELWLRLVSAGWQLTNLPLPLFRWRDHDGRLTWSDPRYGRKRHLALKATYLAKMLRAHGGKTLVWGAGPTGLTLTRQLREEGIEVKQFVDLHPRKVGQRIHGIEVLAPSQLGGFDGTHLIAAVGAFGAREEIRGELAMRGWREGAQFTCAA